MRKYFRETSVRPACPDLSGPGGATLSRPAPDKVGPTGRRFHTSECEIFGLTPPLTPTPPSPAAADQAARHGRSLRCRSASMTSTLRPRAAATVTLAVLGLALLAAGCDRPMSSPVGSTPPPVSAHASAWDQLVNRAGTALEEKHYAEAIALFESALKLRPDATVFALLGDCYWSQWKHGNHDPRLLERANAEYLKGLPLDPAHCGLNHAIGRDLVLLNRPAEALAYLEAAKLRCLNRPLEAQNFWFRIQALVALQRLDEAKTDFADLQARFAASPMTERAGRLLAATTQDAALLAKYGGDSAATKK